MKMNMGMADRGIRVLLAVVIAALYFTGYMAGLWAIVLLAFAGVLILTSFVGVCPLYLPFGISTRRKKSAKDSV